MTNNNKIEKIKKLLDSNIGKRGLEVFEDESRFLSWMNSPNKILGGKTPIKILNTERGKELILKELGRIEHGVIS